MTEHPANPNGASEAPPHAVIITGMSGSGKSTAIRALEDAGFFCIDNLPVPLLPKVFELASGRTGERHFAKLACVVDTREPVFLDQAGDVLDQLREGGAKVQLIFLDAQDDVLVRRFSETRRRHPLDDDGATTVRDALSAERALLQGLRDRADIHIDTTSHTPHKLKAIVQHVFEDITSETLSVTVMSFGFKHGLPLEADLVFDVRFLHNPYFVEGLRELSGLDGAVRDYVLGQPEAGRFVALFQDMAEFVLPLYDREGKSYLTIAIGCTGGQHRSVALAEAIGSRLRGRGWEVVLRHRDVRLAPPQST